MEKMLFVVLISEKKSENNTVLQLGAVLRDEVQEIDSFFGVETASPHMGDAFCDCVSLQDAFCDFCKKHGSGRVLIQANNISNICWLVSVLNNLSWRVLRVFEKRELPSTMPVISQAQAFARAWETP